MKGIGEIRLKDFKKEFKIIEKILSNCDRVDKFFKIPTEEFIERQKKVYNALSENGFDVGFVFSDEHYDGDVAYLGGNTNIQIEQVAGVIGKNGFHIIAGLEGGYIAEQLAERAKATVHKVEMLKLADEEYPIKAERIEDVIEQANGGKVKRVALLTPRQVIPASIVEYLEKIYGKENVCDAQEIYYKIKYEKSDNEMKLIKDACIIGDVVLRCMLAVLKPGMLETQVAGWGYLVGKELGAEEFGWDIMVGANTANRTLIGKALNRVINEGDYVHLGVAPKRDGLTSCVRRSVVCGKRLTKNQKFWFNFIEEAYKVGLEWLKKISEENLPAYLQEEALINFFKSKSEQVSKIYGKKIELEKLKPYTGTHNAGYTECQEFYGAITLNSKEVLGNQIVIMLDVAVRGIGDWWNDVIIPDMDFVVIENTCGKFGQRLEELNKLPYNVQKLVGNADEY
ncbi:MAG: M24 family metallopeptidase [Candidatus Omnitrophica bacterium]|nr:M24 family metallopeptidase [Candidatus Omnitrophota bacterium]